MLSSEICALTIQIRIFDNDTMGMVYDVPPGSEPNNPNIFQKLWNTFNQLDKFAKFSIIILILIFFTGTASIGTYLELNSRAGSSLFDHCTPIPSNLSPQQVQQLSQSGKVRWCSSPTQAITTATGVTSQANIQVTNQLNTITNDLNALDNKQNEVNQAIDNMNQQ